jgi:hypothetical protein
MNAWPIFQPQDSASDLANHPHRVVLVPTSAGLAYPALCPYCGKAASRRILVQKVFRQAAAGDSVTSYRVEQAEVPYCDDCTLQHERERRVLTWPQRMVVSLATGLTVSGLGSIFMALLFLPAALRDIGRPGFPLPLVVMLFFAWIAYSSLSGAWKQNAYRRVAPQTSITLAFDFSESYAPLLDAARCTYAIRNAAFAEAFIALNSERVWHERESTSDLKAITKRLWAAWPVQRRQ